MYLRYAVERDKNEKKNTEMRQGDVGTAVGRIDNVHRDGSSTASSTSAEQPVGPPTLTSLAFGKLSSLNSAPPYEEALK
jgi:hypothetical protein